MLQRVFLQLDYLHFLVDGQRYKEMLVAIDNVS